MNELVIKNSDSVELRFNGELIQETESEILLEDEIVRKFSLRVYAIEGGGYVPLLEYHSGCPDEKSVTWFEEIDAFEDVEKFYYAFDVSELMIPISGQNRDTRNNRDQMVKLLAKKFELLMFSFLDRVKKEATERAFIDRVKEPKSTSSIWDMFKIK